MQVKALPHMNELLTLKAYSEEKDAQSKQIEEQLRLFEKLLASVKDGSIRSYPNQEAVIQAFGPPVVTDRINYHFNQPLIRALYRHPIHKLAKDRVYLYFDVGGQLITSEHIPKE